MRRASNRQTWFATVILLAVAAFAQFGTTSVSAQPASDARRSRSPSPKDLRALADLLDKPETRAWLNAPKNFAASAPGPRGRLPGAEIDHRRRFGIAVPIDYVARL